MPKDYLSEPRSAVRRRDRAVEDQNLIRALLHRLPVGVLAFEHEGQPYVNSNLFVYDEAAHAVYTHTARVGRTRAVVSDGRRVCFSVFEMGRLLPAAQALEFSVEYESVIVFGTGRVVTDVEESRSALHRLLDKYAPHLERGRDYRAVIPEELDRTSVFRIDIEEWSGKRKQVAPDFPGAFVYGAHDCPV